MATLSELLSYGRDVARGASNSVAGTVSAPVDGISWLLRKMGAGNVIGDAPVGGSDWMARMGLTQQPKSEAAGIVGESLGNIIPMLAAAKGPQIAAGLNKVAANAAAPATMNPQMGAVVYHGSPHTFDKFDMSKIGTGEGAQAYGHGLYFADSQGVAKNYQDALAPMKIKVGDKFYSGSDDVAMVATSLDGGKNPQELKAAFLQDAQRAQHLADTAGSKGMAKKANDARRWASMVDDVHAQMGGKPLEVISEPGSLYKVDLPDEHIAKMLDWDKPLSQQKHLLPGLRSVAEKHGFQDALQPFELDATTGRTINDYISRAKNPVEARQALVEAGIPGIKYLDGGSRGAGQGTSNYVVFDDQLPKILERNGTKLRDILK